MDEIVRFLQEQLALDFGANDDIVVEQLRVRCAFLMYRFATAVLSLIEVGLEKRERWEKHRTYCCSSCAPRPARHK